MTMILCVVKMYICEKTNASDYFSLLHRDSKEEPKDTDSDETSRGLSSIFIASDLKKSRMNRFNKYSGKTRELKIYLDESK